MNDKEIVAQVALEYVKDNTIIGLGTGSTANYFIEGLAKKIKNDNLDIKVVASSTISQINATQAGLAYVSLDQIETIDLYVDGADEIELSTGIKVLKGRGYDLIREKLLASSSKKCIIIGDNSKIVTKIGDNFPIPIETSPIAWKITKKIIEEFSINCDLRKNTVGDGFAITSYGNLVLDCNFKYSDISSLSKKLSEVPGVLEHGIFLDIAHLSLIANEGKVEIYKST
ncbi:MAG: ribose 5-phosphate isomerase A [Methylophilaceae bacterium]|jgi:ribose 5-phosphate isomerase A